MSRKKSVKKTKIQEETKKNISAFDEIKATKHEFGKQAREVLEEQGCKTCKKGDEKFVYTSTYIKDKKVYIEVVCITCKAKFKVLMPELSPEDC